eukprot:4399503-Pleurochrysis_carterae.AAC.1
MIAIVSSLVHPIAFVFVEAKHRRNEADTPARPLPLMAANTTRLRSTSARIAARCYAESDTPAPFPWAATTGFKGDGAARTPLTWIAAIRGE